MRAMESMMRSTLLAFLCLAGCDRPRLATEDGKQIFETICARCHGNDGKGEATARLRLGVPDMSTPEWQGAHADAAIAAQIRDGSKNKKMPGFGDYFTDEQIAAIVAHVRTLGGGPASPTRSRR